MRADKYHGSAVASYEKDRRSSPRWAKEQAAVERMVTRGPVLDVPLGTGRYVDIYRAKRLAVVGADISADMIAEARRLRGEIEAVEASIFDLPFPDQSFGTAVCTRLLDWLYPDQMAAAMAELRRVAREIVVSIRHGREREEINYTHSLAGFYGTLDGLHIEAREVTENWRGDTEEIFKLRPAEWADVLHQFSFCGGTPAHHVTRIANDWAGHIAKFYDPVHLGPETTTVRAEYWHTDRLWGAILRHAEHWDSGAAVAMRYVTDERPRRTDFPPTIFCHNGAEVILDGRRRINLWAKTPGVYPVLVVRCRDSAS